ncbi:MAG: DUF2510 domain-containing protein [Actinomycetes bacterium]
MLEFTSLKVSADAPADLATQLTSMSAQGWQVVNIVAANNDIVAYLSRPVSATATVPAAVQPTPASDSVGWAATNTPASPSTFILPTPVSASGSTPVATQSAVPNVPADWYKDPAGRYEFRYWDGSKWTENVSRAGVMYKDPPTK